MTGRAVYNFKYIFPPEQTLFTGKQRKYVKQVSNLYNALSFGSL